MTATTHTCPVCGYSDLAQPAYDEQQNPSFDICPSCYYHFGYDDNAANVTHQQWRQQWIAKGMPWNSKGIEKPFNWNPRTQLLNVGVKT